MRVKNLTTLKKNVGRVILRSADIRKYVVVTSFGSELELKDLSQSAVYVNGNDDAMTFKGFAPSENGYTVEVKVKTDEEPVPPTGEAKETMGEETTTASGGNFVGSEVS